MSGEIPGDIDARLSAAAACKDKECTVAGMVPPGAATEAKAPVAVWSHEITTSGGTLRFPKQAEIDLYGVVVKGAVGVQGAEGGAEVAVKRWAAFHAPGGGVSVVAKEAPARVVLVAVASGGAPIASASAKLRDKDTSKIAWTARPGPIETVDLSASKDLAWAGGAMHARLGFEGDKQRASVGLLFASKDASVAQHQHDGSWEVLAVLRGGGTLRHAKAAGATDMSSLSVTDGTVALVPQGTQHAWQPGGAKPLVAVQIYAPPGPEQRFKTLAESK